MSESGFPLAPERRVERRREGRWATDNTVQGNQNPAGVGGEQQLLGIGRAVISRGVGVEGVGTILVSWEYFHTIAANLRGKGG